MKLLVGLGNPGKEYEQTRHNIGFMIIDYFLKEANWQEKWNALITETRINNEKVIIIKPLTYMNLSGNAVSLVCNFYKISSEDILVIQDDLDLPIGTFRLKTNSSDGGHNGIKSIIEKLGTKDFARLKIGISNNKSIDTKDYVLAKFNKEELNTLKDLFPTIQKVITSFIENGAYKTMNLYNRKS